MRKIVDILWRSILVGVSYTVTKTVIASILILLGLEFSVLTPQNPSRLLLLTFLPGFLMGAVLGPVASFLSASKMRCTFTWTAIIFLNLVPATIEDYFLIPGLLSPTVLTSVLLPELFCSIVCGIVISVLFGNGQETEMSIAPVQRSWYSWTWRFFSSAACYLILYFAFDFANYEMVGKSYYETHSSLAAPEFSTAIKVASLRAMLIIASILPLITSLHLQRMKLAFMCGMILFVIGGIIPLFMQTSMQPPKPFLVRGLEIFFHYYITGAVAAVTLGTFDPPIQDFEADVFYHLGIEEEAL